MSENESRNNSPQDGELKKRACPSIDKAIPPWPSQKEKKSSWIGLHSEHFIFTHHSSHGNQVYKAKTSPPSTREVAKTSNKDFEEITENLFCIPPQESKRLLAILKNSKGGSVLVTGYRGIGKSSLVNYSIAELINEKKDKNQSKDNKKDFIPIRLNLSTSRTAMALVMLMIKELYNCMKNKRFDEKEFDIITEVYQRFIGTKEIEGSKSHSFGGSMGVEAGTAGFLEKLFSGKVQGGLKGDYSRQTGETFYQAAYTLHEAQQDLHRCLKELNSKGFRIIFILDELDKLTPNILNDPPAPHKQKLLEIQNIASDLKFLLTEANAFNIFIAGKDVDDSWQEDQNKGEGLFESIFVQNIYLPSTFSVKLKAAVGPHKWIERCYSLWKKLFILTGDNNSSDLFPENWPDHVFKVILNELGIVQKIWTYNTGLLVMPHLSENELFRILLRYSERYEENSSTPSRNNDGTFETQVKKTYEKIGEKTCDERISDWTQFIKLLVRINPTEGPLEKNRIGDLFFKTVEDFFKIPFGLIAEEPMSERRCRLLKNILQYLTYKGRGIPRKILREFYALVQHKDVLDKSKEFWVKKEILQYIVYIPPALRQKITFFSNIVRLLERNEEVFRYLGDKGCVATFHIIDYILKFYQTGFRWSDIENASFMTQREELFPSRELVATILEILEGHVIIRLDRRHKIYGLLPRVKHDLARLCLAFGPEQIELRFTKADFATELALLMNKMQRVEKTTSEQRLESFKAQIRIAKLYELLGNLQEARHEYSKALRWIRTDINRMMSFDKDRESTFNNSGIITFISMGVDSIQRLGYLYELNGDFDTSLHYYQSAVRLIESTWQFTEHELPGILGKRMQINSKNESIPHSAESNKLEGEADEKLEKLIIKMVPNSMDKLKPFTGVFMETGKNFSFFESKKIPVYSVFEPVGFPDVINQIAIVLEKKWFRYACNRYLLIALDLHRRRFDDHKIIDQMLLIGEVLMRRRDIHLAASWYLQALSKLASYQKCDEDDLSSKKAGVHRTTRAKLFEYLGDIYFATDGMAIIDTDQLKKDENLDEKIHEKMDEIRGIMKLGMTDTRDDEYFYTQATYNYGINQQPLRECEVYLKRLEQRLGRLFKILRDNNFEISKLYKSSDFLTAVRIWCTFWFGVEKIMCTLFNSRLNDIRTQPPEKGAILDRRRFGELLNITGRMLMMTSRRELKDWYLEPGEVKKKIKQKSAKKADAPKNESGENNWKQMIDGYKEAEQQKLLKIRLDIDGAISYIHRIIATLIDKEPDWVDWDGIEKGIFVRGGIGNRSSLRNLASIKWREITSKKSKNKRQYPNAFVVGQLYCLCDRLNRESNNDVNEIKKRVHLLYLAEISLLSAYMAFDDSLRASASANTSQKLGILYLQCIEYLLKLRASYSKPVQEKEFAALYTTLHLASKRFLVDAIDTYKASKPHARCTRDELMQAYRALGDLLLIRAEVLEFYKGESDNLETTFNGLSSPWEKVKIYININREHVADDDIRDVRHQVGDAYRDACRQYLNKSEDYIKRYRFPNDVYFLHKNIMDSRMHFEICKSINIRHWDYKKHPKIDGGVAAFALTEMMRKLAFELFNPTYRVNNREEWLEDISEISSLISKLSPNDPYIEICKNEGKVGYRVKWVDELAVDSKNTSIPSFARNFFRSYDDGLVESEPKP